MRKHSGRLHQIFMHERILEYLVQLAQATREHEMLELGMSPRGAVALAKMAKAGAYLAGREYVVPADVRGVFGRLHSIGSC